ncbi:hypothetical protein [Dapis sp. BLCC M229]|uniref:hypothetical protein n=1 Tax=Dapis sp. BLCC M229 TaxID=3400188 RepID=UPI003CFB72B6
MEVTEEEKVVLEDRQNKLLESLIENRYEDIDLMQLVFNLVTTFPYERRYQFIDLFCKYNQSVEDFNKLPLEPYFENYKKLSAESFTLSGLRVLNRPMKVMQNILNHYCQFLIK